MDRATNQQSKLQQLKASFEQKLTNETSKVKNILNDWAFTSMAGMASQVGIQVKGHMLVEVSCTAATTSSEHL